jgi:DNA (cytosine-5)-methyltransferase 1
MKNANLFDMIFINLDSILASKKENYELSQAKLAAKERVAAVIKNKDISCQNLKARDVQDEKTDVDASTDTDLKDKERKDKEEILRNKNGEFQVEKILDSKQNDEGAQVFLVSWFGYGPEENTWEPIDNLDDCILLFNNFIAGEVFL